MTDITLYHYTCDHGRAGIGRRGKLRLVTGPNPINGLRLIWLTTEAEPDRERTGLTSHLLSCDRMAYRYRVLDRTNCEPWLTCVERWTLPPPLRRELEQFGDPEHWWIARVPVPVELAPAPQEVK